MKKRGRIHTVMYICIVVFILTVSVRPLHALLATYSSGNYIVNNPVVPTGGGKSSSGNFNMLQSIGQSVIGKSISQSFQVWSGFLYFPSVGTLSLSGNGGTREASLSWNSLRTYGGAAVDHYEFGIGAISGSYVFESVGVSTSIIKSGLSDATTYYTIVKAVSASGKVLALSNEVVVTTSPATITPPSGGGGGGGGGGGSSGGGSTTSGGSTGTASVIVSGMAYPGATVTILKDGVVAATTVADPGAAFRVTLANLPSTHFTFSVYAQDGQGVKSAPYSFPATLTSFVALEVANIFLAPTIGVTNSAVKKGEPIGIFGTTVPNAQVTLSVHSYPEFVEKLSASAAGTWFKQFDTSFLEIGSHVTFSRAVKGSQVTPQSIVVPFTVGDTTVPTQKGYNRSDLNNDGFVNVIDLSMLIFYWKQKPPATSKADINKNGIVDTVDLSIMLYDWTG